MMMIRAVSAILTLKRSHPPCLDMGLSADLWQCQDALLWERDMSQTRKLAAILVADVVGYSRLAGADEDRILARLRTLRSDLIDPTIAVHHGRVRQAHWRRSDHRIPQCRGRCPLRDRNPEQHGRA
jgi:class 3 adenylate cyclase